MVSFVLSRAMATVPVFLLVTLSVFVMLALVPGDSARLLAGPGVSQEIVEELRRDLGLDKPLPVQYLAWLGRVMQGDFGRSMTSRQPVLPQVATRFLNSLQLACVGMGVAIAVGIPLGIGAARRPGSFLDMFTTSITTLGISIPVFWVGILLVLLFSVKLGWLPATGKGDWTTFILPGLTIGIYQTSFVARMTRATMLEVLRLDYIRTAKAKGLREGRIDYVHALRNAIVPVVTILAVQFGYLLGGAVLTETVFVWPGLGRLMLDAILRRDLAVVQGAVLVLAATFLVLNLLADILYGLLDPRVRHG